MFKKIIANAVLIFIVTSWAIADEYRAEAGDRLFIYVLGYAGYNQEVIVRSDGKISYVGGDLAVHGSTPEEIASKIEERLKKYIKNPVVFVSPLAKANEIFVMGAVTLPNVYRFGNTDKLELRQAIATAGGMPESGADLTKVAIIKKDGNVEKYDITQLDNFQPIFVYPGDTVIVPTLKHIEVKGNVQEPAKYRIKGDSIRIDHALAMAGGPLYDANLPNLVIYRSNGGRIVVELDDEFWKAKLDEDKYLLYPDDVLFVPNAFKTDQIKVIGYVRSPGSYRIRQPIDLIEAMTLAGGAIRSLAKLKEARIIRADKSVEQIDITEFPLEQEVFLYPGDTLEVPKKFRMNWSLMLSVVSLISSTVFMYMAINK